MESRSTWLGLIPCSDSYKISSHFQVLFFCFWGLKFFLPCCLQLWRTLWRQYLCWRWPQTTTPSSDSSMPSVHLADLPVSFCWVVLFCTVVLCCAVLFCAVLCFALQVLCCAVLCCCIVLCCIVLCCIVLCCAVLCCVALCCQLLSLEKPNSPAAVLFMLLCLLIAELCAAWFRIGFVCVCVCVCVCVF